MRNTRIFGRLGALALAASICTLTVAAMAGTANAACFTVENVPFSAPHSGQRQVVNGIEMTAPPIPVNSCYFSDSAVFSGFICKFVDPRNLAAFPQWKPADVGKLTVGAGASATFTNIGSPAQAQVQFEAAGGSACGVPAAGGKLEVAPGIIGQSKRYTDVASVSSNRVRVTEGAISTYLAWY